MCWSTICVDISLIDITEKAEADRIEGTVYKVECNDSLFTYIGERKRSWSSHGAQHGLGLASNNESDLKSIMKQRIMIYIQEMPKSSKAYLIKESGFSWNRGTPLWIATP